MGKEEFYAMVSVWSYLIKMYNNHLKAATEAIKAGDDLKAAETLTVADFWYGSFKSYDEYFKEMKKLYGRQ